MVGPEVLHAAAQTGRDQIEHVDIVKPIVDAVPAKPGQTDELGIVFFATSMRASADGTHWSGQMGCP